MHVAAASPATTTTAYVAFLCNEAMLLPILVLIRSLKANTGHHVKRDICIMVTDGVDRAGRQAIEKEGAIVLDAPETPYPFPVTEKRKKMAKSCRYAKMHLWGLTQYNRIVYLDADTMVVGDIEDLFSRELPAGPVPKGNSKNAMHKGVLAVHDRFAGIFNSGVMVLEPSKQTIDQMLSVYMETPSYNMGDQGFLNMFWKDAHAFLEGKYNYFTWLALSTWGKSILKDRRVVHYTAEVKPWNFLDWQTTSQEFFGHLYIADLWQEWVATADTIQKQTLKGDPRFPVSTREKVCTNPQTLKHYTGRKFKGNQKTLTVILKTVVGSGDGSAHASELKLAQSVTKYAQLEAVEELIVVWPTSAGQRPDFTGLTNGKKVTIHESNHPANAIFFPHLINTAYVLVADHNLGITEESFTSMFRAARTVQSQAVGPFVYDIETAQVPSPSAVTRGQSPTYSVLDTSMAIIRTDYLFLYTCILDTRLLNVIDMVGDCEELLMNVVAGAVSEFPVLHMKMNLNSVAATDDQTQQHRAALSRCAAKFKTILKSDTLNLRKSHASLDTRAADSKSRKRRT